MNPENELTDKILDSTVLVNWTEAKKLKEEITKLAKNHHIIIVSHIRNETKKRLASKHDRIEISIYFEKTLKELQETGKIDMSLKYDRLEKKFKILNQVLAKNRPKVERVDRYIICVASQIASHICSRNGGIAEVISKIKKARFLKPWREYFKQVVVQYPNE